VTKPGPTGAALNITFSYEWDELGQMVRAKRAPITVLTNDRGADFRYTYDAGGERVTKSVEDPDTFQRTYTSQVFSTLRLEHARFQNGDYERTKDTITAYLVANGTSFARLVYDESLPQGQVGGAQHVFFTLTDPMGSTSTVVDKNTGELVERTTYLAYGQAESDYRPERWKAYREHFRFTGKEDDVGVGLTYFGARYYVAALGQWASADPLTIHGASSDLNPYAYVFGSPQRLVDPLGLQAASQPGEGQEEICPECIIAGRSDPRQGGLMGWNPFGDAFGDSMTAFWGRVGGPLGPIAPNLAPKVFDFGGHWDYVVSSRTEPSTDPRLADTLVIITKLVWFAGESAISSALCLDDSPCGHAIPRWKRELIWMVPDLISFGATFSWGSLVGGGARGPALAPEGPGSSTTPEPPADFASGTEKGAATKLPRFNGVKPSYTVNPAHVAGRGLKPGKTPLPADAEQAFGRAVPNDPTNPTAWFGKNADGQIYRFSPGNDGTAHFSGIQGVGDGTRNLTQYAIDRLNGL